MDLLTALCQLAALVALGLGLPLPNLRRVAIVALGAAAAVGVAHGLFGPEQRSLVTTHAYAGYEGPGALEVSMVDFPTGTTEAPGWQWPLPFFGFAVAWIAVLLAIGKKQLQSSVFLPVLFAWSAAAAWLAMQWLAAPVSVVRPAGLDRCLWPAGLAAALLAATRVRGVFLLAATISGAVLAARLPAALFSKYATEHGLGTSLDVGKVVDVVNPVTRMTFDPPLAPGSSAHEFWLIWVEHVIVFPTLHWLSLFGCAIGVHLWHKHPDR